MGKRESNDSSPEVRYMPAVIEFLGYNPLPEAQSMAEHLVRHRTTLGLRRGRLPAGSAWTRVR